MLDNNFKNRGIGLKLNKFIFIEALILFGGFYDWNIVLIGAFLCLYELVLNYGKQGGYKKEKQWILWIPEIIFGFQIAVSFWSVDRSANTAGIVRGIVILLWLHVCLQWGNDIRMQMLRIIPDMGSVMVIMAVIAFFFDKTKRLFWMAERLGVFFNMPILAHCFYFLGLLFIVLSGKVRRKRSKRMLAGNWKSNGSNNWNTLDR